MSSNSLGLKLVLLGITVVSVILTVAYSGLFVFLLLGIAIFAFSRMWPKHREEISHAVSQGVVPGSQVQPPKLPQADNPRPVHVKGPSEVRDKDEFERRARHLQATLRIGSHETIISVLESGDGAYEEIFNDVEPYGDGEVPELVGGAFRSEYGYFNTPVYDPPNIQWRWTKTEDTTRFGNTVFNPPLRKGKPISFVRKRRTFNMVHFNEQDRRDSLWDQRVDQPYENIWFGIRQAYHEFRVELLFPNDHKPLDPNVEVRDSKQVIASSETARAKENLSVHQNGTIVRLYLERPLCGYQYSIVWSLPPTEADGSEFSAEIRGLREEALQRLRKPDQRDAIAAACLELRNVLREHYDPEASVLLYVYGRNNARGGLCPVGDTDSLLAARDNTMVLIGRTLVGQSYRRNAEMLDSPLNYPGHNSYYEPLPGTNGTRPKFAAAVPLFIPASKGLRLGIVYIQSCSSYSGFNRLLDKRAAKETFYRAITRWHVQRLMPAVFPEIDNSDPEKLPWI